MAAMGNLRRFKSTFSGKLPSSQFEREKNLARMWPHVADIVLVSSIHTKFTRDATLGVFSSCKKRKITLD